MKYGNLNFLEPSGPLHACYGTDFLKVMLTALKRMKGINFVNEVTEVTEVLTETQEN